MKMKQTAMSDKKQQKKNSRVFLFSLSPALSFSLTVLFRKHIGEHKSAIETGNKTVAIVYKNILMISPHRVNDGDADKAFLRALEKHLNKNNKGVLGDQIWIFKGTIGDRR